MKAQYYDPMFYLCSEEMPFTIRIEVRMKEPAEETILAEAMQTAIKRYPYFAVELVESDGEWLTIPNPRPLVVYRGTEPLKLGSEALNRHLLAASCDGCSISFLMSHVMTDGGGFFPFVKTALYYYLCRRYDTVLEPTGIRLCDDPLYPDELTNPFPEEKMAAAEALYRGNCKPFFRLRDGGYVTDRQQTAYHLRTSEAEMMRFSHDHDGSPCALVSALLAQAVWSLHPDVTDDLVSAVSFNLRPGLGNKAGYRMLCNALSLHYPNRLRESEITRLCTCTRGMITLQSQPENVLAYAQQMRQRLSALEQLPDAAARQRLLAPMALKDATDNTFSVSYVGQAGLGAMEPYLDAIYNYTDGSTQGTLFVEIMAVNGWFDIVFLQGFSSDAYYRAFLRCMENCGLHYLEDGVTGFHTPQICLP